MARARTKPASKPGPTPEQSFQTVDERYKTLRAFGRYGVVIYGLWTLQHIVEALAGQETNVYMQAGIALLSDIRVGVLATVSTGLGLWAFCERKLREKTILRMHDRIKKLELNIDPSRSSSKLTQTGKTNPSDWES